MNHYDPSPRQVHTSESTPNIPMKCPQHVGYIMLYPQPIKDYYKYPLKKKRHETTWRLKHGRSYFSWYISIFYPRKMDQHYSDTINHQNPMEIPREIRKSQGNPYGNPRKIPWKSHGKSWHLCPSSNSSVEWQWLAWIFCLFCHWHLSNPIGNPEILGKSQVLPLPLPVSASTPRRCATTTPWPRCRGPRTWRWRRWSCGPWIPWHGPRRPRWKKHAAGDGFVWKCCVPLHPMVNDG